MQLKSKKYLYDTHEACEFILEFTNEADFNFYNNDRKLQSAVERQFEIIGEALNQLHKIEPEIASMIPEFRKIISLRNILIHAYTTISNEIIWGIVESDIHVLKEKIESLIRQ